MLFVHHLLSLSEETISLFLLDLLLLAEGHLGSTLFVQLKHALFAGLSCSHSTVLLFLEESSLLYFLFLSLNLSSGLHPLEFILVNHDCLALQALHCLLTDVAQLILSESGNTTGLTVFLSVSYYQI